jgi:dipeptidase
MVALPSATARGQTIFAKNSDRPADECQPLVQRGRRTHAPGAKTSCQFVELPEVPVTYRHVGSRPHWCWGYEHGFNEHQVVIGNEAVFSRFEEFSEPKLVGMEIVRLGLERSSTAAEAVRIMTDVIARFGQGKFANDADVMTYDNSYIVADPREAYVIETAGHQWAAKPVVHAQAISNLHTISTDWSMLSSAAESEALKRGWWDADWGRFDFGRAYAMPRDYAAREAIQVISDRWQAWAASDLSRVLSERGGAVVSEEHIANVLSCRHDPPWRCARSSDLLNQHDGAITVQTMMSILRDHGAGHAPGEPLKTTPSTLPGGICYHRAPDGRGANTAASLVADLCADGSRLPVYWCSFYSPCLALFLPIFIEGELPGVLSRGSAGLDLDSPWWQFRELSRTVYEDIESRGPLVQDGWKLLQDQLLDRAYEVAREGRRLLDLELRGQAVGLLTDYMSQNTALMVATVAELRRKAIERVSA